ncbi:hypothetical protein MMC07_007705 [Pseudocyphellaria aurata]|nr:hypothetical protein [Pseudocyphellaria aurata]
MASEHKPLLTRLPTSEIESARTAPDVVILKKDKKQACALWLLYVASLLLATSIGFFVAALWRIPNDLECAMQLSPYSPMLEAIEYEEVNWVNDFDQPSIYRGYPSPEREIAWNTLWQHGTVNVPEKQFESLNHSRHADYMRTPAEHGHGVEAAVEVFHQLHCLNMIRQYTYLSSYPEPPPGFNVPPDIIHTHIDHCIETLRHAITCTGDVTPIPIKADPKAPAGASADFSTHHKCRRWDRLTAWMHQNEIAPPAKADG